MRILILALLSIWLAAPVLAADGDPFINGDVTLGKLQLSGKYLCSGKDSGDNSCTAMDFASVGFPDQIAVAIYSTTGCSGTPTLTLTWSSDSGCSPEFDADVTPVILDDDPTWVSIDLHRTLPQRYLCSALGTMTACSDFNAIILFGVNK